jgi:redox-sensitive bicupin YhaK (pirin superfamily)
LPHEHEETTPTFKHHPAESIPKWHDGTVSVRLLAGTAAGRASPVEVLSELVYLDLLWESDGTWNVPDEHTERALYAANGALSIDGQNVPAGHMALLARDGNAQVQASAGTRAVMIGGAPLDGPRHIWWNFVSSQRTRIEQAKADWEMDRFPEIAGENERIPLPK